MAKRYKSYGHFNIVVDAEDQAAARQTIHLLLIEVQKIYPDIRFNPVIGLDHKITVFQQ